MLTREEAAVAMGMKLSEVVEVVAGLGDTTVVTTHDGVRTMVTSDGQFLPYSGSLAAPAADTAALDDEDEPSEVPPATSVVQGEPPAATVVPDQPPADPPVVPVDPDEPGQVPDNVDVDGDGVPDGPASGVLAWVGTDSQRAAAALDAERARDKPRSSLISALERLVGG